MDKKLVVYASGDGALSFGWECWDNSKVGGDVKLKDVKEFLYTEEGQRLVGKGFRPYVVNANFQLVGFINRISSNTLYLGDEDGFCLVKYWIGPLMNESSLVVEYWVDQTYKWMKLVNLNSRARILFFIRNEKQLRNPILLDSVYDDMTALEIARSINTTKRTG